VKNFTHLLRKVVETSHYHLPEERLEKSQQYITFVFVNVLPLLQNISKSESKKVDVFGSKFRPNTFIFVDQLLLIFCNGGSMVKV
jgi:hypothetical protein